MVLFRTTAGERHHIPNHALRDSISLSSFSRIRFGKAETKKMYRTLRFLLLFTLVPQTGFGQFSLDEVTPIFTVVLDAGHGGKDSGTHDGKGRFEKNINLYVAKFVRFYLNKYAPDIKVVLTRDEDVFLPLGRRPLYARLSDADLFVSLHCNHNPNKAAQGAEIYIQNTTRETAKIHLKKAVGFGLILEGNLEEKLNYRSRGILMQNFQVLRESIDFVPSVLVELGFFSNTSESSYLNSKEGIQGLSLAITKSIMEYFEMN